MDEILAAAVECLKEQGARPFIVPAMGSHGGATAEGQRELLASYQITEERCGCPILSSMETVPIGSTPDGQTVFLDRYAAEADGILVVNRMKAHTGFRGRYESGILKMMVIGLGKQTGAEACHRRGFGHMAGRFGGLWAGCPAEGAHPGRYRHPGKCIRRNCTAGGAGAGGNSGAGAGTAGTGQSPNAANFAAGVRCADCR